MGREKYQKQIEKLFKKSPVVSFNSIERIIKDKKPKYFVSNGVKTLNALHPIISTKNLDEKVIKVLIPDFNQEDYSK